MTTLLFECFDILYSKNDLSTEVSMLWSLWLLFIILFVETFKVTIDVYLLF